jgi:hypothetical protein
MRIVVGDASCLADLGKALLLDALLRLPHEIFIPNTLFHDSLPKLPAARKEALVRDGLKVVDIPASGVLRAQDVIKRAPRLSVHDAFAFALAEGYPGCVLVTGNGHLGAVATQHAIEVQDLLWIVDEIHAKALHTSADIAAALRVLAADESVRLPRRELRAAIKKYETGS